LLVIQMEVWIYEPDTMLVWVYERHDYWVK
jgi:hypothetical protein